VKGSKPTDIPAPGELMQIDSEFAELLLAFGK
jgi:hypothetical protein